MGNNILIVDDEYYICEGLHKKLVQLNHPCIGEILTCLSGEEAISVCKTYKPHIIFTDIKMSGINGIELIHALRETLHPVQFIVLSGYDDFEYVRGAFQNGAIDYLLKPVLNDDLTRVVAAALSTLDANYRVTFHCRGFGRDFQVLTGQFGGIFADIRHRHVSFALLQTRRSSG